MNATERAIHDMKQYAFTKRKLEASILMGEFLEDVYPLVCIWRPFAMIRVWWKTRKLLKRLGKMSQEVSMLKSPKSR